MALTLWGSCLLLLFANPCLLIYTWDWWLCLAAALLYIFLAARAVEIATRWFLHLLPILVDVLLRTRVDVYLPLRVVLHSIVIGYPMWMKAGSLVSEYGHKGERTLRRLSSRSTLPLLACGMLACNALEPNMLKSSIAALALAPGDGHVARKTVLLYLVVSEPVIPFHRVPWAAQAAHEPLWLMAPMGPMGPMGPMIPLGAMGLLGPRGPMGPMGPMTPMGRMGDVPPWRGKQLSWMFGQF
jgi:hypothetical protein